MTKQEAILLLEVNTLIDDIKTADQKIIGLMYQPCTETEIKAELKTCDKYLAKLRELLSLLTLPSPSDGPSQTSDSNTVR